MKGYLFHIVSRSVFFLIVFLFIVITALSSFYAYKSHQYKNVILPNVYINDVSFEGKSAQDIDKYFEPINKNLAAKMLIVSYEDSIATFSGELLGLRYNSDVIRTQATSIGRNKDLIIQVVHRLRAFFNLTSYKLTYEPEFKIDEIDDYLSELEETYSVKPVDARFEIDNGKVSVFKPEEAGIKIKTDEARDAIVKKLSTASTSHESTYNILVLAEPLEPDITLSNINELGIVEIIGVGNSDYTGSSPERVHNLQLAASKFHGVLVPPDEVFSYNKTVGDISAATGYKSGYIIKDGRTVYGDGGGVCQDSTTLFRAALNSGLPIVERKAHSYRVKYYENDSKPGFDATVFAPSVDFKFKNDTGHHILIQTKIDEENNLLTFEFWGKKDGRVVELSDATLYDFRPPPEPLYQDDPSLPRGTVKQVDWPSQGTKSQFTYKVTKDGEVIEDKTFVSNYRPWQAVYLVGVKD